MPANDYHAPADLLANKVILVTGAGRGIGRAAALSYAAHGATVILLGRDVARLESVYDEIEAAGGPQPAIMPMDLGQAGDPEYQNLAEAVAAEFGRLDGLLHNAGILGARTPIQSYSLQTWNEVMQINLNAVFALTSRLLGLLQQAPRASILFTSSGVGRLPRAYWGAYAVSKAAVEAFMQVLHQELENTSRIRVNSINPGATRTAMRAKAYPAENPERLKRPEDLMPLYLYLMGDDSATVNGQQFDAQ